MPKKNSGMWYEVHPTPVKGSDGRNVVYVRPKSGMKLTMKQLEDYCERNYAVHYGELSRAFEVFVRVAGRYLAEGYRIETPIGSFAPKLSLKKQVTSPDEVRIVTCVWMGWSIILASCGTKKWENGSMDSAAIVMLTRRRCWLTKISWNRRCASASRAIRATSLLACLPAIRD